jgi:hypothetical protein
MEMQAWLAQSPGIARLWRVRAELARLRDESAACHEEWRLLREDAAARGDSLAADTARIVVEEQRLHERRRAVYAELRAALRALGGHV